MNHAVNAYYLGECPAPIWRSLYYFSDQKYDAVISSLKEGLNTPELKTMEDYWLLIWDALSYTYNNKLINDFTSEYLATFDRNPPETSKNNTVSPSGDVAENLVLSLLTVTQAESEEYLDFFDKLKENGAPFIIRGGNNKSITWNAIAVSRLLTIIQYAQKNKIMYWGENLSNLRDKLLSIHTSSKLTELDEILLLEFLRLEANEDDFTQYSIEIYLERGLSPPEYYPPPSNKEKSKYFPEGAVSNKNQLFVDGVFYLNSTVNFDDFITKLETELKDRKTAVIDLSKTKHMTIANALRLSLIHQSSLLKGDKISFVKASPMIHMLLKSVGFTNTSFQ